MTRIEGFPPLLGPAPRVLILGSMPSVASLEKHQYYGKPQNAFWRIMGDLFGAGPDLPYDQRVVRLADNHIAVWDVLESCVRPGSLDSAIEMSTAAVNEFDDFFARHISIHTVFFNGRKAEELFMRRVHPNLVNRRIELGYACLPSTSPAMATLDFAGKLKQWKAVSLAASKTL